jgi:hypothetical protein
MVSPIDGSLNAELAREGHLIPLSVVLCVMLQAKLKRAQ